MSDSYSSDQPDTLTGATAAAIAATAGQSEAAEFEEKAKEVSSRTRLIAILGTILLLTITVLVGWGLYSLGDDDQSSLERLRDVAIVFALFFFVLATLAFFVVVAVFGYLALVVKDEMIPAINSLTATLQQVQGTTTFVTESAVRPIIRANSRIAGLRAAIRTVAGK